MSSLVAITYKNDILIVQAYKLLKEYDVQVDQIYYMNEDGNTAPKVSDFFLEYGVKLNAEALPKGGLINDDQDYKSMENVIMMWYRSICLVEDKLYVFIGGGHKILSMILQRCAYLFGASEVFHMLFAGERGTEPKSLKEVESAILSRKIIYSSMGSYPGWPALSNLNPKENNLRKQILEITSSVSKRNIDHVNEYPFECINLLPPNVIQWLEQPIEESDRDWIAKLPKTDLHCHLGGLATHGKDLVKIRSRAIGDLPPVKNIPYPSQWPLPSETIDLGEYMHLGDNNGSYILSDRGCLEAQVELTYDNMLKENIRYTEVRCSPYNYTKLGLTGEEVLLTIVETFEKKMKSSAQNGGIPCHVNLIIIATRKPDGSSDAIDKHVKMATEQAMISSTWGKCEVVGIDLAGYEHQDTRASYYELNFLPAHKAGIDITIHAGENDVAEGIWEAVYKLNTRRIGHGLHLYESKELLQAVVNRKIGIEMCPFANFQIKGFKPMPGINRVYPLMKYLDAGAQVCINTDNIGISAAGITDNFMLLRSMCPGITRIQILKLIRNGLEQAFIDYGFRSSMLKKVNQEIFRLLYFDHFKDQ